VDEKAWSAVTPAHRAVAVEQQEKSIYEMVVCLLWQSGRAQSLPVSHRCRALWFGTTALTWVRCAFSNFHLSTRAGSPGDLNLEAKQATSHRMKGKRQWREKGISA
jgi:hypothetical protein